MSAAVASGLSSVWSIDAAMFMRSVARLSGETDGTVASMTMTRNCGQEASGTRDARDAAVHLGGATITASPPENPLARELRDGVFL
jgi:hypothetical protein